MKYIALLAVLLFMGWTWQMAQAEGDFGVPESREIEAQMEELIRDHILAERPEVKSISFHQLFTEVLEPGRLINVHTRYTIEEATTGPDVTRQLMQGLVKLKSSDGINWALISQELTSPALEFQNGIRVEADAEASTETETPETAPETKSE